MERNKQLGRGEIDDKEKERELWADLMLNLNAVGDEKPLEVWKQIWQQLIEYTKEKQIDLMDIRILNILGCEFTRHSVTCQIGGKVSSTGSNQIGEEMPVVERNQTRVQNQYLAHMLGIFNAQTRVVESGFRTLNENIRKVSKIMKRKNK